MQAIGAFVSGGKPGRLKPYKEVCMSTYNVLAIGVVLLVAYFVYIIVKSRGE